MISQENAPPENALCFEPTRRGKVAISRSKQRKRFCEEFLRNQSRMLIENVSKTLIDVRRCAYTMGTTFVGKQLTHGASGAAVVHLSSSEFQKLDNKIS